MSLTHLFSPIKNDKGIVLFLAMSIITILIASTLELNREIKVVIDTTLTSRNDLILDEIASSGVELARAILAKDINNKKTKNSDTLTEEWADATKLSNFVSCLKFPKGKLQSLSITDETGKIPLNALITRPYGKTFSSPHKTLFEKFFKNLLPKQDNEDTGIKSIDIVNAIKDWIDASDFGQKTGTNGAELSYYESNSLPSFGIDSPFAHIDAFKRVRGIYKLSNIIGEEKINELVTVYGAKKIGRIIRYEGKININTAKIEVLMALMPKVKKNEKEKKECPPAMLRYRETQPEEGEPKKLTNPNWYKQCKECAGVNINASLITVRSNYFKVTSVAELNGKTVTMSAIIFRQKIKNRREWETKILYRGREL